jgi:hypothetical protein
MSPGEADDLGPLLSPTLIFLGAASSHHYLATVVQVEYAQNAHPCKSPFLPDELTPKP